MDLTTKLRMAGQGCLGVIKRPRYAVSMTLLAFVFALLVYLVINFGIYGSLLTSSLSLLGKIQAAGLMTDAMFRDMSSTANGALLLVVAILQGISLGLLIFTIRRNKKMNVRGIGGGGAAAIFATLGLGCVPCGTSIILPIVSIVFSSSAYAAANIASVAVLVGAFLVSLYSIYQLGFAACAFTAADDISATPNKKVAA